MIFLMTREKQTNINKNKGLDDINTRQQPDVEQPKPPSDQTCEDILIWNVSTVWSVLNLKV